jgi:hypothetical protein
VAVACEEELNARLAGTPLSAELGALDKARVMLDDIVRNKVNHQLVAKRAEQDSALGVRVLEAFTNEINLISLDPVFIYDVAALTNAATVDTTRHALGGGVRVTFASHVSFMGGYAVNLNRAPGEPSGAAFVSLKFIDLIR